MIRKQKAKYNQLTIDFGPFCQQVEPPAGGLFQKVRSEMLKKRERLAHRRKPFQYERLEGSLQDKLKQKAFNKEDQRVQMVMLQKCKNYFQMRRSKDATATVKTPKAEKPKRPATSVGTMHRSNSSSSFFTQLQGVMDDCGAEEREIKENMTVFTFYCRTMNRRLDGIRHTIEKKERMI